MKARTILLIVSTLVSLVSLVYALIQKKEADIHYKALMTAQLKAEQLFVQAEEQHKRAEAVQKEAERQMVLAQEALANCDKSKKK